MTTASVLLTVTTSWNVTGDKIDKEGCITRAAKNFALEAAKEIRETSSIREQAVRIMREWIQQNCDVRNVRQDDAFILRFLRQKKYSIPMAQQTLLKYLSLRQYYPDIFQKLDCEDPKLQDIINSGYVAVSPVRDSKGRRVIVYNMSKFNGNKYGCWDMCRAHVLVYESLMGDSLDQMCGFTHVGEATGVSSALITSWNPNDFARLLKWGEQSMPMRHKEIHLVNIPTAIKYIIDFAASKVSPKIADRLNIHSNIKTLHKKLEAECLPKELGGKLQFSDMVQYTKKLLSERRQEILDLDKQEILSTRGITSSRRPNGLKSDAGSVEGSFRKLEID